MPRPLYFRLLGPLTVERDGSSLPLGGTQRRGILGLLLLRVGMVVSMDDLVEMLWEAEPPASYRTQLHVLISGLRKSLGTGGDDTAELIETRPPGYRLAPPPGHIDLEEFRGDVASARRLAYGDPAAAARLLSQALARWRGPAFADIPYRVIREAAAALDELRLTALEDRIEADIALGRYGEQLAELTTLTEEHPFRERFRGHLMTVLARTGRPAEALNVYLRTRELLVEELGIEPSRQLQHLQRAILMGVTEAPAADLEIRPRSYLIPQQLPPDVPALVDRDRELLRAIELLRTGVPARYVAITGPGGVGKTAFALHVAHQLRTGFPDGQLFARLDRTQADEPTLARFLHALGVPPGGVPRSLDARASLFRDLLADRRILIVLDDATSEAQVRPLMPAEPGCGLLVTSRRRLTGLEAATSIPLKALAVDDGVALLREAAGATRVDAESAAAMEVVRHCGSLPLALRVVGARLAARPNWMVRDVARRLADTRDRLDWLQLGDQGVRASLAESYADLNPGQQRLFRLLGLLEKPEFPGWLPAALLGHPADPHGSARTTGPEQLLDELVDVHLVEPADRGTTGPRYRMHALVHLVARELTMDTDAAPARHAAHRRALHGWFAAAATADDELPHWIGLDPAPDPEWRPTHDILETVRESPLAWLDDEVNALLDTVRQAAAAGRSEVAWPLAQRLSTYLDMRGRYDEWTEALICGLQAADAAGDAQGRATMHGLLLQVAANRHDYAAAFSYAQQAFIAYNGLSSGSLTATDHTPSRPVVAALATPEVWTGPRLPEQEAALEEARSCGDPLSVGFAASRLAIARRRVGVHGDYLGLFEEALDGFRAGGEPLLEMWATKFVGVIYLRQGRIAEAEACLLRGLELFDGLDGLDGLDPAFSGGDLAGFAMARGRLAEAEAFAREAVANARVDGDRWSAGRALITLGDIARARGADNAALDSYLDALRIWRSLKVPVRITQTLFALADLCTCLGDPHSAAVYRAEYTSLVEQLDLTEEELRRR